MSRSHYKKDVSHLTSIDPYRLQELYSIPEGPIFHAWKKLIAAGQRGAKDVQQDVTEAIESLQRWQEMRGEDERMNQIARNGNDGEHYQGVVKLELGDDFLVATTTNPNKL